MKFQKIKISDATKEPKDDGVYCLMTNRFWLVTDDDCILIYRGYSPQCNRNKQISESILKNNPLAKKVLLIDSVWIEHVCD
jgi:hypothetical protein